MNARLFKGVIAFVFLTLNVFASSRDAQWKGVLEATNQGLPKTAIERLEPIIKEAIADKAYAEALRAISQKIALQGVVEGNKPEEKIVRLEAELANAPTAMKPLLEVLLADWYWQYFQRNRWEFAQRTQTAVSPGPDIRTWDLARVVMEIDKHFSIALGYEATLKATPIAAYDELLEEGNVPTKYRPTLYDFVANEALHFYQAGEHAGLAGEDAFEISASDPIFADFAEFLKWKPVTSTSDSHSSPLKAVFLYQSLLKFHSSDRDRSAFYDADLARLNYGKNVVSKEEGAKPYKTAVQRFIKETAKLEISARAIAALATELQTEGELLEAHHLAESGLKSFPTSVGAAQCYNLIQQIEVKSIHLETEKVWAPPSSSLEIRYRNTDKVYFRAIPKDFSNYLKETRWNVGWLETEELRRALAIKPALEWAADLPPTTDFKERVEQLQTPNTLPPGFYFIIASHDPDFHETNNLVSGAAIWVGNLALVLKPETEGPMKSGMVLNATSGEPFSGATIHFWERNRDGRYEEGAATAETDEDGQFHFSTHDDSVVLVADYKGQKVSSYGEVSFYNPEREDRAASATMFFTDRALYRPGQTINYKGVSIRYDQGSGKYSAISNQKLTVVFKDPNNKEVARAEHQTNDYGSFSGVFTAPRDRLMGRMTVEVLDPTGSTSFNIEEYKRPKFQVAFTPPAEAAKLEAPINLTGRVTAYTGATIGGAKVKWRIVREARCPYWCWWWRPSGSKMIAHGTSSTDQDGLFNVVFTAEPDRSIPPKNEPIFTYSVHADVTDTTGETRSADFSVRAGYTALQVVLSAESWQTSAKPVQLKIASSSLDGEPRSAEGTITVHALKQPTTVARAALHSENYGWRAKLDESKTDPTNPDSWELGEVVAEKSFATSAKGEEQIEVPLKTGIYRALLETKDRFGERVTARQTIQVIDHSHKSFSLKIPNYFEAPKWSLEPGETFTAAWGTGYDTGRAFVELECDGKLLKSYWTAPGRTLEAITQLVTEDMRGGFTVRVTCVRENRAYINEQIVEVPWSNKQLTLKWESFRSKLTPGQKETWSAIITGNDSKRAAAEMVAALYDASLDQFQRHYWPPGFGIFREERPGGTAQFQNNVVLFSFLSGWTVGEQKDVTWIYRTFPREILGNLWGWSYSTMGSIPGGAGNPADANALAPFAVEASPERGYMASATLAGTRLIKKADAHSGLAGGLPDAVDIGDAASPMRPAPDETSASKPDLSKVVARKNLNETAFFFPQLTAGDDGVVRMTFTMPEALTEWKFLGFAHDKQLRSGFITDKVVTSKDLMVEPNPPRFVREGDAIEFTVKVSNQSDQPQVGRVKLTFADAASLKSVDDVLGNHTTEQPFDVPAKQSRSYSWRVAVPDGVGFLTYKAVAATAQFSDGEEGFLPVLSRRILVTESLPLPIRGKSTKQFEFKKLLASGASDTLRHQSLTVQMTSQPAWYAVMALPYLMEYPYECSEQLFNRFYSNALARHIANSDPKIRHVFDLWKNTPALDSPMEKNQDLKSVMLEETPWLRQAKAESEGRRNVGLLFDGNRLDDEMARALNKLADRQLSDGLWSWFPGGRPSEYISLYIVTGFGRLRHLGVEIDVAPAIKALAGLDAWMEKSYRDILRQPHPEGYVPDYTDALYLYGRSFFLKDLPIASQHREAIDFFLRQSRKFWLKVDSRQSQAHLAIALQRFGDAETPQAIMKSLKERSVSNEELGMFWRDTELSWWWYHAPIETQALMIEAFAEVTNDAQAVDDCKVWLLKQKQTQDWKTTKATADAIYGLLLRGSNLLASDALVEVALAGQTIKPEKVEAGTGFYEQKFSGAEIKPAMGNVTVTKTDEGVSWGSVHWQYLEDLAKVTPHEGTPLKLKKTLWVKETTGKGQVLKPVTGPVAVGDELVVRVELRTDRDMEYVHLKDQRGSGTEPVNVLSRYKYQDGLGYYESTRDTASHFFIDYLPKGVYVFEYSVRVQLKGAYQTGIAEIQCMYAPEFNSHSESIPLEVK